MKTKTVKEQLKGIQETVEKAIKSAGDNLLDDLVECDRNLLELAILIWLEEYIENLPMDIEFILHKSARLQKLIFQAQLQTDLFSNQEQQITSEEQIKSKA
jgi:hypothetical protein